MRATFSYANILHVVGQVLDQITLADLLQHERGIQDLVRSRLAGSLEAPPALMPLTLVKDD